MLAIKEKRELKMTEYSWLRKKISSKNGALLVRYCSVGIAAIGSLLGARVVACSYELFAVEPICQ